MPKSRHRKKHKKKAAHRKLMKEHDKRRYQKKLQEMWGEEMAKAIAAASEQNGETPDVNDIGGLIG